MIIIYAGAAVLMLFALLSLRHIPFSYILGNLKARKVSLLMSVLGIGVVIAVMVSMKALDRGVELATRSSASKEILLAMREGAEAEISSWVARDAAQIIRTIPGVDVMSPELNIIFKLPREGAPKGSNVVVRGVTPAAFQIRPYVKIVEGRMFRPSTNELIVAKRIGQRFNLHVGETFTFGPNTWSIVGAFDANGTAYDSEVWADGAYLGSARKREQFSAIYIKPRSPADIESITSAITNDNRLKLHVRSEYQYYTDQMNGLIGIKILVAIVAFFMIFGAVLGTMNTMFSAVAPRQRELATLRALGFSRRTIIGSVVLESAIVATMGAVAGIILALPVNGLSSGTVNWSTFSELAFSFRVDSFVMAMGFVVALVAGIYGGAIPAIRTAQKPITTALREI
ncbi:MAG TPA: FtsX-like permease family protein [Thermoanaerobaculia bacterium]|nr:FtsX-like permease family protein [Thermoanaerobaculia bacterium]